LSAEPSAEEAARTEKMVKDGMAAAQFFEEHDARIAREEAQRDLLQGAILLGAMLLALIIRAMRGSRSSKR
jgi:hypothetical protein